MLVWSREGSARPSLLVPIRSRRVLDAEGAGLRRAENPFDKREFINRGALS